MPDFRLMAWKLSDFSGAIADAANSTATVGDFAVGTSTTLDAGAVQEEFIVTDDDDALEDAFVETGALTTLTNDLILDGVTYPAGSNLEAEFLLQTDDIPPITFIIGRIGPAGSNSGENLLVFTTSPIAPGQSFTFASANDGILQHYDTICFTAGTLIETPSGLRDVAELCAGDLVRTRDHGVQPIRWAGARLVTESELWAMPDLRPIRVSAGALGPDLPEHDLIVSPQHRLVVGGWRTQLLFGAEDVLVPAKALINDDTIQPMATCEGVSYHHILLPMHALVRANGHWAETLLAGPVARGVMPPEQLAETLRLFPDLHLTAATAALPALSVVEGRALATA